MTSPGEDLPRGEADGVNSADSGDVGLLIDSLEVDKVGYDADLIKCLVAFEGQANTLDATIIQATSEIDELRSFFPDISQQMDDAKESFRRLATAYAEACKGDYVEFVQSIATLYVQSSQKRGSLYCQLSPDAILGEVDHEEAVEWLCKLSYNSQGQKMNLSEIIDEVCKMYWYDLKDDIVVLIDSL